MGHNRDNEAGGQLTTVIRTAPIATTRTADDNNDESVARFGKEGSVPTEGKEYWL